MRLLIHNSNLMIIFSLGVFWCIPVLWSFLSEGFLSFSSRQILLVWSHWAWSLEKFPLTRSPLPPSITPTGPLNVPALTTRKMAGHPQMTTCGSGYRWVNLSLFLTVIHYRYGLELLTSISLDNVAIITAIIPHLKAQNRLEGLKLCHIGLIFRVWSQTESILVSLWKESVPQFELHCTTETMLTSGLNIVHSYVPLLCILWGHSTVKK